jgi:hypothetical protein
LFDFHSGDNIYSDLIENLQPGSLTRFQQEFLMLDIKTMKKDRLRYFNKRAGRVALKFDLWKALDFERDLEVASCHSDDSGIQILKYVHDHGKEATNPIKDIQFKELS